MIPDILASDIDLHVGSGATHVGIVLMNDDGLLFVSRPKAHPYGITATFPRVRIDASETPFQALTRCLEEKIGTGASCIYPLPQLWVSSNSSTAMFAGLIRSGFFEMPVDPMPPEWSTYGHAEKVLRASHNPGTMFRDLSILDAVSNMCLSPYRRIFLMVRELHQMGFERLRVAPGLSPSGCHWRCSVVPCSCINSDQGTRLSYEACEKLEALVGYHYSKHTYGSGQSQEPFGWTDVHFDSPRELASKFVERFQAIAFAGWGADPEYGRWYQKMLSMTEPNGLFIAYADFELPDDYLKSSLVPHDVRIPLPPPAR